MASTTCSAQQPAPCLPLGAWDDRRGDSFFAAVNALRAERCAARRAAADDSAVILFTSGTSARPKGVVLSFRELLSNAEPTADGFALTGAGPHLRFPLVQLVLGADA